MLSNIFLDKVIAVLKSVPFMAQCSIEY